MAKQRKVDLELLLRVISLCQAVEQRGVNPFEVEVKEILDSIKKKILNLKSFEDLSLDAETINYLSRVVKLQEDWLRFKASTLYFDPGMVESKISTLSLEDLADVFLEAWHPAVGLERLSAERLKQALMYWNSRSSERFSLEETSPAKETIGFISLENLSELNLLSNEEFSKRLDELAAVFREKVNDQGEVSYWDFIYDEKYGEFILKAYLISFLVSYGYAQLIVKPLREDEAILKLPTAKPSRQSVSIVMPINHQRWLKLKRKKQG